MKVDAVELLDALYAGDDLDRRTRVNHARGISAHGTFTAHPQSSRFSSWAALTGLPIPVLLRFSSSSGILTIPDSDPLASPRGLALTIDPNSERASTFVGHSVEGFPASTPEQFLAFLSALHDPDSLDAHLRVNENARSFLSRLPTTPASFLLAHYHFLHAYTLTRGDVSTVGRISIGPRDSPSQSALGADNRSDFLEDELAHRVRANNAYLRVHFQLASDVDDTADIARPWAANDAVIELGQIRIDRLAVDQSAIEAKVFDPGELGPGIELLGDPMIKVRSSTYEQSFLRRSR